MHDWEALVGRQLNGIALGPAESAEVIAELAEHLAETCEELRSQGMTEKEAVRRTMSQVEDWQELRRKIQRARMKKEDVMSNRIQQFWIPGILTFVLSMGLLALIQKFGPQPWILAWGPPLILFYIPWLLTLPFIGAMGAYLASRAGASVSTVLVSSIFPILPFIALFVVLLPWSLIIDGHVAHNIMAVAFLTGLVVWVLVPGAALLAGGLPGQFFLSRRLASRRIAGG